jgi:hypothetical protein
MKFNPYILIARAFPAILSMIPFFVLYYFFLNPLAGDFLGELLALKITSAITLPLALFFLMMQLNRLISKGIFEKRIYKNGLTFPTTDFLLHLNSNFSSEYTKKIHNRIRADFGINIPNNIAESKNENLSRKYINEAVSHIRSKVGKGTLLGQHNAEYGFVRNFSGGNVVSAIISALNIIIFTVFYPNNIALTISCITLFLCLVFIVFARKMIRSVGRSYAKVLIQEYMATQPTLRS